MHKVQFSNYILPLVTEIYVNYQQETLKIQTAPDARLRLKFSFYPINRMSLVVLEISVT